MALMRFEVVQPVLAITFNSKLVSGLNFVVKLSFNCSGNLHVSQTLWPMV